MTGPATLGMPKLSALRLVSFVPPARDAVHAGLLTPDAQHVIDLAPLGVTDALEAIDRLPMLRQAAGAIIHGDARVTLPVHGLHLVAPIPLVRSVVQAAGDAPPEFIDPVTLHGPGGHISRAEAAQSVAGLGAVIGTTLAARTPVDEPALAAALVGSTLVLGSAAGTADDGAGIRPVALGPYVAVPLRAPESLVHTLVAPLAPDAAPDRKRSVPAPTAEAFMALARAALRSHTLRPGDVLTIFPAPPEADAPPVAGGSWVRISAPGLGTLSIAVR